MRISTFSLRFYTKKTATIQNKQKMVSNLLIFCEKAEELVFIVKEIIIILFFFEEHERIWFFQDIIPHCFS